MYLPGLPYHRTLLCQDEQIAKWPSRGGRAIPGACPLVRLAPIVLVAVANAAFEMLIFSGTEPKTSFVTPNRLFVLRSNKLKVF